jgi:hypothetical protein
VESGQPNLFSTMPDIIKAKINIAKIHGAKVLKKDGRTFVEITACALYEGANGAIYLEADIKPAKDSTYGDDWMICQWPGKELRDKQVKGPIIGNAKNFDFQKRGTPPAPASTPPSAPQRPPVDTSEDSPF